MDVNPTKETEMYTTTEGREVTPEQADKIQDLEDDCCGRAVIEGAEDGSVLVSICDPDRQFHEWLLAPSGAEI